MPKWWKAKRSGWDMCQQEQFLANALRAAPQILLGTQTFAFPIFCGSRNDAFGIQSGFLFSSGLAPMHRNAWRHP